MAARRRASGGADPKAVDDLLRSMRLVKAARFNSAERLVRKDTIGQFALAMVALYFIGLTSFQAVYGAELTASTNRLLTLVSIISSVFTLVLGFLETRHGYEMKASQLQACALQVNELAQELSLARPVDVATAQEFRRRYNEAVRACPVNHAPVDLEMARLGLDAEWRERLAVVARYLLDVYGLHCAVLAGPPLMLIWLV